MKKTIYILFIGLFGILLSCKKEGTQIVMLENPIAPTIVSMPSLTLERSNGTDILEFVGTPVNPGFEASANYFLEACASGNNFVDKIVILTAVKADLFKISVSDLNGILLKKFPADAVSSVDFRLRSVLVVDAGTGAPGTSTAPFEYISATNTKDVTLYGLPKLDLINSGVDQSIESALGNGDYKGFVKVDDTMPFTVKDPDTNIDYGGSNGVLVIDGTGIITPVTGWQLFSANTVDLTYSFVDHRIGLVGSATPNGWDAPDQKMDYDATTGTWYITLDLVEGFIKFRRNDGWSWNMGLTESGVEGELMQGGVGNDIPVTEAGNYTIVFTILNDDAGTYTITKN